jgi:DNA-binding GntR family transcriptional regulator
MKELALELPPKAPNVSLSDRVYVSLKQAILNTELAPGETIVEPLLAEQFGISKTPVREALRQLVVEGLVITLPRKGYVVRPVGFDDVLEVLAMRAMLEPPLVTEAVRRRLPHHVEQLQHLINEERDIPPGPHDIQLSLRFHELLAEIAGNSRASAVLKSLLDETVRIQMLMPDLQPVRKDVDIEEHGRILEALSASDPDAAREAMASHLEETRKRTFAALQRIPR